MCENLKVVRLFDPWKSQLCSCPVKYSLNPYTGCGHGCLYCYVSYVPKFFNPRTKKDLIRFMELDMRKVEKGAIISISNSSDPYQPIEADYGESRKVLEALTKYSVRILIITKSAMILKDLDIFRKLKSAVMLTVTTLKNDLAQRLEPFASPPFKRLYALEKLVENGIPCGVRIDPIIPCINEEEVEEIVKEAKARGASHVTSSTYKARKHNFIRIVREFPQISKKLRKLYLENGQWIRGTLYAPEEIRREIMERTRDACAKYQMTFSTCREGFYDLNNSESCDGSHLINQKNPR
ncbi:MAG: radical SAM protein [Deltaproteobacteria bacterium]|nr:radical SAM protein [Deltaproteobacteria bacterium]